MTPDIVRVAVEAYRAERERLAQVSARQRRGASRDLAVVERKIKGIIAMAEAGGDARALAAKLNELGAQRRALTCINPTAPTEVVALHPNAAERYANKVRDIHGALANGNEANCQAIDLVRELIERIVVTPPTNSKLPMKLEFKGNLAALMEKPGENPSAVMLVAGGRYSRSRYDFHCGA